MTLILISKQPLTMDRKKSLDDEEMCPISYCLIFAIHPITFHPKLDIDCITVFRSFQDTLDMI